MTVRSMRPRPWRCPVVLLLFSRHNGRHRFRCPSCSTCFCGACRATPYHIGFDCEGWAAHKAKPKCPHCGDAAEEEPGCYSISFLLSCTHTIHPFHDLCTYLSLLRSSISSSRRRSTYSLQERCPFSGIAAFLTRGPVRCCPTAVVCGGGNDKTAAADGEEANKGGEGGEGALQAPPCCGREECRERANEGCRKKLECGHPCRGPGEKQVKCAVLPAFAVCTMRAGSKMWLLFNYCG